MAWGTESPGFGITQTPVQVLAVPFRLLCDLENVTLFSPLPNGTCNTAPPWDYTELLKIKCFLFRKAVATVKSQRTLLLLGKEKISDPNIPGAMSSCYAMCFPKTLINLEKPPKVP